MSSMHTTWCLRYLLRSRRRSCALAAAVLALSLGMSFGQTTEGRPVPLFTGSVGFLTNVDNGVPELQPIFAPVVLAPIGDHWLIESRGEFSGEFDPRNGRLAGQLDKELDYAQIDYIGNRYVTVTAGRFLTPFGIYNERLYPIWIRKIETLPLIFPIGTGSSDGFMLRGGFAVSPQVSLNYATYFSVMSNTAVLDSDRLTGGRIGLFLPGPRVEVGASFQQLLQEDRSRSTGFHFAWQPNSIPLNLRSEYAWSGAKGSGYWVEAALGLAQVSRWQHTLRHVELVGRGQQYFVGNLDSADSQEYGLPQANTNEGEFGVNYYFRDGMKGTFSYGRQLSSLGNANVWTFGIAYRFVLPMGRTEVQ